MSLRKIEYGRPTDKCAITVQLGIQEGLFEEEGLDLSVKTVFGGPQIADAYDNGDLEIGEMGSPPAINAIAEGKAFQVVGSGVRRKANMFFAVRKGIESYEELKGKRIGMLGIGSCPDWIMQKILRSEGVDPELVEFVPLLNEYPKVVDYVADGRIDACIAIEPNVSIGEDRGVLDYWVPAFDAPYLPNYQWIVHVARKELLEREPTVVESVLRGCQRSAHYAANNVDEWANTAAGLYGTSTDVMRAAIDRELPHFHLDGQIDVEGMQKSIELQFELGGIPEMMNLEDFLDLRFQPTAAEVSATARV